MWESGKCRAPRGCFMGKSKQFQRLEGRGTLPISCEPQSQESVRRMTAEIIRLADRAPKRAPSPTLGQRSVIGNGTAAVTSNSKRPAACSPQLRCQAAAYGSKSSPNRRRSNCGLTTTRAGLPRCLRVERPATTKPEGCGRSLYRCAPPGFPRG